MITIANVAMLFESWRGALVLAVCFAVGAAGVYFVDDAVLPAVLYLVVTAFFFRFAIRLYRSEPEHAGGLSSASRNRDAEASAREHDIPETARRRNCDDTYEASRCIGYSGSSHVDGGTVTQAHSTIVSVVPKRTGQTHSRVVRIEGSSRRLSTDVPIRPAGLAVITDLELKRGGRR